MPPPAAPGAGETLRVYTSSQRGSFDDAGTPTRPVKGGAPPAQDDAHFIGGHNEALHWLRIFLEQHCAARA